MDVDIERVNKMSNIRLFAGNSIKNNRDWKLSEIENEVINYINLAHTDL